MTEPKKATDIEAQVQALMAATGLDASAVRMVLVAQDQQAGEPIGTVRFDPASGSVAHRVEDRGVPKWLVSHPTEGWSYEMAPTKETWTLIEVPQ